MVTVKKKVIGKQTYYYNALERAQVKKQDNIFVQWFFRRYVKEHKRYLE